MRVLLGYDEIFLDHDSGDTHPERPERLRAVLDGAADADLDGALLPFTPRPATEAELARVHTVEHIRRVEEWCLTSRALDPDTFVSPESHRAALTAAGSGLEAIDRLRSGQGDAAFLAVRPPGHHARPGHAMGFCLFNNVAVAAARLVAEGERVLILDWDAHHGNGTQEIFYEAPDVLVVSMHQFPYYPGSGSLGERGSGEGTNTTMNLPFPAGTGGDAYRRAIEEAVVPAAELFSPSWLLVSCGFDAHRDDPLTDLGLSAGDFADLTERVLSLAAPGRRLFFLEGGYDLDAVRASAGATLAALCGGHYVPERITNGPVPGHGEVPLMARPEAVVAYAAARVAEEGFPASGY